MAYRRIYDLSGVKVLALPPRLTVAERVSGATGTKLLVADLSGELSPQLLGDLLAFVEATVADWLLAPRAPPVNLEAPG